MHPLAVLFVALFSLLQVSCTNVKTSEEDANMAIPRDTVLAIHHIAAAVERRTAHAYDLIALFQKKHGTYGGVYSAGHTEKHALLIYDLVIYHLLLHIDKFGIISAEGV